MLSSSVTHSTFVNLTSLSVTIAPAFVRLFRLPLSSSSVYMSTYSDCHTLYSTSVTVRPISLSVRHALPGDCTLSICMYTPSVLTSLYTCFLLLLSSVALFCRALVHCTVYSTLSFSLSLHISYGTLTLPRFFRWLCLLQFPPLLACLLFMFRSLFWFC